MTNSTPTPSVPQGMREAVHEAIKASLDSQGILRFHPWALSGRILTAIAPHVVQAEHPAMVAALRETTAQLKELIKGEFDDKDTGIVGWNSLHELVASNEKLLSATPPSLPASEGKDEAIFANIEEAANYLSARCNDWAALRIYPDPKTIIDIFQPILDAHTARLQQQLKEQGGLLDRDAATILDLRNKVRSSPTAVLTRAKEALEQAAVERRRILGHGGRDDVFIIGLFDVLLDQAGQVQHRTAQLGLRDTLFNA